MVKRKELEGFITLMAKLVLNFFIRIMKLKEKEKNILMMAF